MSASTPDERTRLLEVVRDLVRARLAANEADSLLATIDAHVAAITDTHLLRGVNPSRSDGDPAWDDARARAYAPTEHVGAVHLELGTFTAFPPQRVAELIAGDGLAEFLRLDFDRDYRPDLVADVTALPLGNASVDRVASNSLFEHVAYPHRIIEETFRVLRPGGVMVVVMPFVWHRHGYPHDYVRLTPQFFERVCRESGFAEVITDEDTSSGLYNTLHNASKSAAVDASRPEADALRAVHEAVISLLGALIPADRYFENAARQWFHSVRALAIKPGSYEPSHRPREPQRPLVARVADLLADPLTKAPLTYDGRSLLCEFSGMSYAVQRDMAILTEPRQSQRASAPLRTRVKRAAAARRRAP